MTSSKFKQRVLSMQSYLMRFAFTLTSNRDEADDLLQDTTLKVLSNEDKYVDNVNFKGWMTTIMRNIFINNYRKRVRHATVVDTTDDLYHINVAAATDTITPEGTYAASEIVSILNKVTESYRVPFVMYVKGYKYVEISKELKLPVGTVKSRIYFARRKLRTLLEGYEC